MSKIVSILTTLLLISAFELYLLIWLGRFLGPFNTVVLELAAGITGATVAKWMVKKEALAIRDKGAKGIIPIYEVISVIAVLLGAFLMLFPGIVTDLLGVSLIIPGSRHLLIKHFQEKIQGSSVEKTINEKIVEELKKKGLFNN